MKKNVLPIVLGLACLSACVAILADTPTAPTPPPVMQAAPQTDWQSVASVYRSQVISMNDTVIDLQVKLASANQQIAALTAEKADLQKQIDALKKPAPPAAPSNLSITPAPGLKANGGVPTPTPAK